MSDWFADGRIADLIILLTAIEGCLVVAYRRRTGRGPELSVFLTNLLSGVCLIAALRAALMGQWWGWVGAWLALGGIAHAASVRLSWR